MSQQAIELYIDRLSAFLKDFSKKVPKGVDKGLFRQDAIKLFNDRFFHKEVPTPGPFSDLKLDPEDQITPPYRFPKMFMDVLVERQWYQRFGITYNDLMNMSYHEYCLMLERFPPLPEPQPQQQSEMEKITRTLAELLHGFQENRGK